MTAKTNSVLTFLQQDQEIIHLQDILQQKQELAIYGLYEGQRTLVTAALFDSRQTDCLLAICDTSKRAKELWEDLSQLLPEDDVLYFPALEMIPYEVLAQSNELECKRVEVLTRLLQVQAGKRTIVVTVMDSLSKKLLPPAMLRQGIKTLRVGDVVEPEQLRKYLVDYGYEGVEQVEQPGQFAVRGGIVDIYSPRENNPVRLEFFDDEVDSVRPFDVKTQCSIEKIQEFTLVPAREFFLTDEQRQHGMVQIREEFAQQLEQLKGKKNREPIERLQSKVGELLEKLQQGLYFPGIEQYQNYFFPQAVSLLDYLPANCLVVLDEANRIQEAEEHQQKERLNSFADLLAKGSVLPGQSEYFYDLNSLASILQQPEHICFSLLPKASVFQCETNKMYTVECQTIPPFFGNPQLLLDELRNWKRLNYRVIILLTSITKGQRLQQMLEENDLTATWIDSPKYAAPAHIYLLKGNISHGAQFSQSKLVLIAETEVFQQQKKRVNKKIFKEDGQKIAHLDDLHIGDYVVHLNHGIGRYLGIERLTVADVERDYLIVKYSGEDKLYIPVEQFDLLQKYVVGEGKAPKVNKLGSGEWAKTKSRVKASVEKIAEELLKIYAKRQSQEGYSFSPDDQWQKEFEEAFPYVETEDQLKAIEEVKRDMMRPTVMDRLICGDVGYGKTEVAIRAAFKAVNDGKQVAILVPTTVLAQQHYNTFVERFTPYGVKVEMLSRFRTAKEQKATIEGLAEGTVDIVVGTHKLLNKSVSYHDLGLLVIDEEQRFGVTHKEKIKGLRTQVDVLTMSATPIPRTLHMSLVGIRDMSIIETPPQDRYPIQTYIAEFSPELIKDAIRRELGRNGQVFLVHNRIDDLDRVAEMISQLVPEARILVGHGQMKEQELENIMMAFINHEADVLISTTIIETGIDIANANTLIVDEADKMGLSQLYQLRGRVGRSNRVAYAYLTYQKDRTLSQLAEKRLAAVREYTELGSGFKIAMRDLEIRGAGNILGAEQSGQVAAVGFDLYCNLLDDAIKELKGEQRQNQQQVEIDLQISALIPDYYIRDSAVKLGIYQRIQQCRSASKLLLLEDELVDRFGDLPQETINLFRIAELKTICINGKMASLKQKGGIVELKFSSDADMEISELFQLSQKYKRIMTYGNNGGELVIRLTIGSKSAEECLDLMKDILLAISAIVR